MKIYWKHREDETLEVHDAFDISGAGLSRIKSSRSVSCQAVAIRTVSKKLTNLACYNFDFAEALKLDEVG